MSVPIPPVSNETQEHLEKRIQAMVSHFTPEWTSDGDRVGKALIRIFAALTQETLDRLNRTPKRNMLAFLDMMGIRLLPKSSALAFLRFHVADGTPQSVIVPARTLVTASSPSGEVPFETERDLNANPGGIAGLFGVDPADDTIYKPPKGFLQKTIVGPKLPDYTTAAFSAANSQSIQLDLVDGIEPGDTLRITGSDYVVKEIKGRIVELIQPLAADVNTESVVSKRTTFELFGGINLQEHVLYLAHSEYLQMKEAAIITLKVKAAQTGDPTDVVWEVFTEDENKVQKWTALPISLDTTQGLSRNGNVVLLKPRGEIKEIEIDGQSGRWIRALRKAPIAPLDRLSNLDSVQLTVESSKDPKENPLGADAGFYNESPVSVSAPPFNPFGFEPQLFDRFQLASAEAFSKIGADVTLDFKLDLSRLLGPPSVVAAPASLIRVFARGVLTRLTEVVFSRNTFLEIKNAPSPTAPGAIPAAVALPNSDYAGVFVRCSDNSIQLLTKATLDGPDAWVILDKPGANDVRLDPAALAVPSRGEWIVFAVADGKLWHKTTWPGGGVGKPWLTVNNSGFTPKSTPAAALDAAGNPILFVFDDQSKLWSVKFSFVGSDWEGQPGELLPTSALSDQDIYKTKSLDNAHPFALEGFGAHPEPTVFFANLAGGITAVRGAAGQELGAPGNQQASADPCCVLLFDKTGTPDHFQVFAAFGDERQLHARPLDLTLAPTDAWTRLPNPQAVSGRPYAFGTFQTQYHLFAAGGQGSMMQLTARTETGIVTEVDSSRMLFLSQSVPLVNPSGFPRFARIPSTPASAPPERLIEPFDGPSLARFQNIRPGLPLGSSYQLFESLAAVTANAASTLATIQLDSPTTVASAPDLWIFVDSGGSSEFAAINNINATRDTITLAAPLTTSPVGDSCTIFRRLHQGTTARGTTNQVLLDENARPSPGAYDGAEIEIGGARTLVQSYDSVNRVVELKSAIGTNRDSYGFPDQWSQLEDPELDDIDPTLSWEYWNGKGWANLLNVKDETEDLVREGKVHFPIPQDIAPTEVAGQSNYWIRARLVGGNYGQVKFEVISKTDTSGQTTYTTERKDLSRPPIVQSLTISYSLAQEQFPKTLLTLNNLDYIDQTAANFTPQKSFQPFAQLDTAEKAVYMGFDQQVSSCSVLFALAQELAADDNRKLVWEALFQNRFQEIDVEDKTAQLTHLAGLVELDIPFVAEKRQFLGVPAYWMRARLIQSDWPQSPELSGVFFNAVEALQLSTYVQEVLGPSDGTPNQKFEFQHKPVLEEEIRVRTQLTEEDRKRIIKDAGEDAVRDFLDEAGNVIETWVLWKEVIEFANSKFDSRHYRLDRASGELRFGDRVHGDVPPIGGDNIRAFRYRSGGGVAGNVDVDTIKSLVTAIGGIDLVSNPLPAAGGSEEATRDQMIEFGPAEINSRDRAVAPADFEFLARQASRQVVKARCIPNRDNAGMHNTGWVSVFIVAESTEAQPQPPLELCTLVRTELLKRAPAALAASGHIFVGRPDYMLVSVAVKIAANSIAQVAQAEANTRATLEKFLHPLRGGPDGTGWEFGQGFALSALYSVIEQLDGVDHVESIEVTPQLTDDYLEIGPDQILASGTHDVSPVVAEEAEAWH
jgi:hypothetical protein